MSTSAVGALVKFNRLHESQYASDKLIKTVGFAAGFVSSLLARDARYGSNHELAVGLKQIAAKCSDVGYALRFHGGYAGVLNELENFITVSFLGGWKDPWIKALVRLQSACLLQYYLYENAGFLGKVAPVWIGRRLEKYGGADELVRKSCWGWGLCCFFDVLATRRKRAELERMARNVASWPESVAKQHAIAVIDRSRTALKINFVRGILFFVPNVQWSLRKESPFAIQPDWMVNGLSLLECILGYYALWNGYSCSRPELPMPKAS